jgi:hypothetical protein
LLLAGCALTAHQDLDVHLCWFGKCAHQPPAMRPAADHSAFAWSSFVESTPRSQFADRPNESHVAGSEPDVCRANRESARNDDQEKQMTSDWRS